MSATLTTWKILKLRECLLFTEQQALTVLRDIINSEIVKYLTHLYNERAVALHQRLASNL